MVAESAHEIAMRVLNQGLEDTRLPEGQSYDAAWTNTTFLPALQGLISSHNTSIESFILSYGKIMYNAGFIDGSDPGGLRRETGPRRSANVHATQWPALSEHTEGLQLDQDLNWPSTPELSSDSLTDMPSSLSIPSSQYGVEFPEDSASDTAPVAGSTSIVIDDSEPKAMVAPFLANQQGPRSSGSRKRKASDSSIGVLEIPRSPNYTSIAPLRRPNRPDRWYSKWTYTDEAWLRVGEKRAFSHVAYIEETDAGMVAPEPYFRCANHPGVPTSNGAFEKRTCMVYKPGDVKYHTKALGNNWRACSRCIGAGINCSIVQDANQKGLPTDSEAGHVAGGLSNGSAPPKKHKTSSDIAPIRRPTRTDAWYSSDTKPEVWYNSRPEKQRLLSHYGYMEETDAGMSPARPCSHCSSRLMCGGKQRLVCKVYKPETAKQYSMAKRNNWRACSHCRTSPDRCDFVLTADEKDRRAARARGDPINKVIGPYWSDKDLLEYATHSGTRPQRQADGSVRFVKD